MERRKSMKKRKRWILWFMTVALLMGSICSCVQSNVEEDPPDTDEEYAYDLGELVSIITDKKTDYVIVYNSNDPMGKYMANELSNLFYKELSVNVPIRVDAKENDYEIVIGNTVRASSTSAAELLKKELCHTTRTHCLLADTL